MMELAKQALSDFQHSLKMLDVVEDKASFRVLCVAAASLNRSIGYALLHDSDPRIVKISKRLYSKWKSDSECIFNTFIHSYRNRVIHDAKLDLEFDISFYVADEDAGVIELHDNDLLYVPFIDSYENDLDIRDWFSNSIEWWRIQFNLISDEYKSTLVD